GLTTAVEKAAGARTLQEGADARRGDPSAEGVLSVDVRAHRLPPGLERQYPSIAAVIAGVARIQSVADVDDGLTCDGRIVGRSETGAQRALKFLEALRDNLDDPKYAL